MKSEEIRALADNELVARIAELEEERFRLKFRSGTEALEEPLRLRSIRRDIARLKTVQRERHDEEGKEVERPDDDLSRRAGTGASSTAS
jgi:large subunit ribosomal protein L29